MAPLLLASSPPPSSNPVLFPGTASASPPAVEPEQEEVQAREEQQLSTGRVALPPSSPSFSSAFTHTQQAYPRPHWAGGWASMPSTSTSFSSAAPSHSHIQPQAQYQQQQEGSMHHSPATPSASSSSAMSPPHPPQQQQRHHQHHVPFISAPVAGSPSALGFGFGIGSSLGGNNNLYSGLVTGQRTGPHAAAAGAAAFGWSGARAGSGAGAGFGSTSGSGGAIASTSRLAPLQPALPPPPQKTTEKSTNQRKRRVSSSSSSSSSASASDSSSVSGSEGEGERGEADVRHKNKDKHKQSAAKRARHFGEYYGAQAPPLSAGLRQPLPATMRTGFSLANFTTAVPRSPRGGSASATGSLNLMDDLRSSLPSSSSSSSSSTSGTTSLTAGRQLPSGVQSHARPGKRALSPPPTASRHEENASMHTIVQRQHARYPSSSHEPTRSPATASPTASVAAAAEPSANRRRKARASESHSEREQLARQLELMLATSPPSTLLALLRGVLPSSSGSASHERASERERGREEEEEESMTKSEIQRRMAAELLRRLIRSTTTSISSTRSTRTKQGAEEHAAPLALPLVLRLVDDSARAVRESIPTTTSTSTAGGSGGGAVRPEYTWSRARAPLRAFAQLAGDALPLFTPGGAARMLRSLGGDGAGAPTMANGALRSTTLQQEEEEGDGERAEAMLAFVCKVTREVVDIERRLPPVPASFLAFAEPRSGSGTSSAQLINSSEESKSKGAESLAQMCLQHAHAAALCPAPSSSTPTPDAVLSSLLAPLLQSWEALLRAAAAQQEKHAERERWGIARARSASRQADEQAQGAGRKGQWLAALVGLAQEIDAALLSQGRVRADGLEQQQGHTGTAADPARTVLLALQKAMQLLGEAVQRW